MEKKEYLNEGSYQRGKEKLKKIALIILTVGILLGGTLITTGIIKQSKVKSNYSEESKAKLQEKLETEKKNLEVKKAELETERSNSLENEKRNLENKKTELQAKGIKYDVFAEYTDGEKYDLKIIVKALDPSFNNCLFDEYKNNTLTSTYCSILNNNDETSKNINVINDALDESFNRCKFDEAKNNAYTSKYCSLKLQLDDFTDFNKEFDSFDSIPLYIGGAFVIIASGMIAFAIFMFAKRREILAFSAQQVMPVAQEGIEKIAPTIGKAGASIAKEMAPVYGDIAKGIASGIKEGISQNNSTNNTTNSTSSENNNTNNQM